jgi:RNA polymerase sigma-70 factor, ECF subfamily
VLTAVNTPGTNDQTLVLRIQNGEPAAFAEIYLRYKHGVYLYCTRFLGDTPAAEDVFQDVFLHCFEQLKNGKPIANVRGYLLSSAHNRCLNVIRDAKHPYPIEDLEESIAAPHHDPDDAQTLQQVLQHLPPENREALLLCEYHGYSYEEIARMTSVPVSTIRKRIYRARQKLRRLLGPSGQQE